jgi:DUF1707 SHOCT-like domain
VSEEGRPAPGIEAGIEAERERVVERLMENFANDVLDMAEFERRVDMVNQMVTKEALDALLSDLPATGGPPARRPETAIDPHIEPVVVPADQVRDRNLIVMCLGGTERKGRWIPARRTNVVTIMGGATLDFREAMLGPGVTEVWIFALMGGVEIIVSPGMPVEVDGVALMGGFDLESNEPEVRGPDQPLLRVRGMAVMGGVGVEVRLPGESGKGAKRRRKFRRKEILQRLTSGETE